MKTPMDILREAKARIREVGISHARDNGAGCVFLDVRDPHEFAQGRLPGAKNVSRGMLEFAVENTLPNKSTPVIVYCGTGGRSALAADVLQQMGYQDVVSMGGGIKAWQDAGLTIER